MKENLTIGIGILGFVLTIATMIYHFGQLSEKIEILQRDVDKIEQTLETYRRENREDFQRIHEKLDAHVETFHTMNGTSDLTIAISRLESKIDRHIATHH